MMMIAISTKTVVRLVTLHELSPNSRAPSWGWMSSMGGLLLDDAYSLSGNHAGGALRNDVLAK